MRCAPQNPPVLIAGTLAYVDAPHARPGRSGITRLRALAERDGIPASDFERLVARPDAVQADAGMTTLAYPDVQPARSGTPDVVTRALALAGVQHARSATPEHGGIRPGRY